MRAQLPRYENRSLGPQGRGVRGWDVHPELADEVLELSEDAAGKWLDWAPSIQSLLKRCAGWRPRGNGDMPRRAEPAPEPARSEVSLTAAVGHSSARSLSLW